LPKILWFLRQPEILLARKIEISFSSVSLLPFDFIAAIICDRFVLEKMSAITTITIVRGRNRNAVFGRIFRHLQLILTYFDRFWNYLQEKC